MASSYQVQKKWVENFAKSAFVRKESKTFNKSVAVQCFHGRSDNDYHETYPENFNQFYNTHYELERETAMDTMLKFLHFIGIKLSKQSLQTHLNSFPNDYHQVLKKTYFLFRRMALHNETLDIHNPYIDNYWDLQFFIKIETGQTQLSIFEDSGLPELYNKSAKIPDGYENDDVVKDLFNRIEGSTDSFFITGKAGTGKSTFIHYFTQKTKKKVILTAFTGIAAINVGGVTLHSFFRFPIRAMLPGDEEIKIFAEGEQRRKIIEEVDTIIIDEVSMLRADLLEAIDYSLRQNGGDPARLFGGKQILFVGDIFQLPPVINSSDEVDDFLFTELFKGPYFFHSDAYQQLAPSFFEFKIPKRQKDDLAFVELLDNVRICNVDNTTLDRLNARFDPFYSPNPKDFVITLTTSNALAQSENRRKLADLPFTKYEFHAEVKGDFDETRLPTSRILELKQHAQVIFIRNDAGDQRRWVNGTIGKVEFITDDLIEIRLPNGNVYPIAKEIWEHRGYKYDRTKRKITSEIKGTFVQYPIRLAWGITIHKSQGLTFDNVIIDLGSGAFVNGQLYTALSRCRKLDGITLRRKIKHTDIIQDEKLVEFYKELQK